MTLRADILASECYRDAVERGSTFTRLDICRELCPGWDSADAAPRELWRNNVGTMLHHMVQSNQVRRIERGLYAGPERPDVYRRPLANVPAGVVRVPRIQAMGIAA